MGEPEPSKRLALDAYCGKPSSEDQVIETVRRPVPMRQALFFRFFFRAFWPLLPREAVRSAAGSVSGNICKCIIGVCPRLPVSFFTSRLAGGPCLNLSL